MFEAGRHEGAEAMNDHQKGHTGDSVLTVRRCYKAEIRKENRNSVKRNAAVLQN